MQADFAKLRSQNITKQLPRERLEARISSFLKSQNVCVLATSKGDIPRATPIEYHSEGTTLYIIVGPGIKIDNIKANPRVSIGIYNTPYADWTDWDKVIGVQIMGRVILLTDDNPEYFEALKVYEWQPYFKARGWDTDTPPKGMIIVKVEAEKIEYLEFALMADGYSRMQILET